MRRYRWKYFVFRDCMRLWKAIYKDPSDRPGTVSSKFYIATKLKLPIGRQGCPACDYTNINYGKDCDYCPLLKLWPDICLYGESPYRKWKHAYTLKRRKAAAKEIYLYARDCYYKIIMSYVILLSLIGINIVLWSW